MDIIEQSKKLLNQEIFQRKSYFSLLEQFLQTNQIIVIQGQRRTGKSYCIMGYFQWKQINPKEIFFLNKELDSENKIQTVTDLNNIWSYYLEQYGEPKYIVIDEIQDIKEREIFIRARYTEKKFKIIISWSNSKLLSWELSTYLAWRYLSFSVYPLGFDEFLEYPTNQQKTFVEYLRYGWLPEIHKIENDTVKSQYLKDIFDSILLKDVLARFQIKDIPFFQKILWYLADNIGNPFSLRNLQNYAKTYGRGNASLEKISHYLQCLEIPFLIYKVPFFNIQGKKILEHAGKYYFNDIGIRNTFNFSFEKDKGKIIENLVFLHLKRLGYEIFVGKYGDCEIDFMAKKENTLNYFQVAYTLESEEVHHREFGNLLKIDNNFPKYVISVDPYPTDFQWIKHFNIEEFFKNFH